MKIHITKPIRTDLGGLPIGAVVEVPDGDKWGEWVISTIYGEEIVEIDVADEAVTATPQPDELLALAELEALKGDEDDNTDDDETAGLAES